ncbi:hypothetical protein ATJ97_2793 [Georgenia soli]|uniref:Phosphate transport regulator n=1 Tax=Georgenia soli TaxID=638953 RepID=A0A2A9EMY1_9MICO|nr:DUF47 family protein [Georgenia soli]PFG40268.1 hypothetical protein ATJ97_2793 [Georgenia soli]
MRFRLTPQDGAFFDLLATSAGHLVRGADLLVRMLGADRTQRVQLAEKLHQVEHDADESTRDFLSRLNQTFVTPFDRDDMHALANGIDDCMDAIDEAGDLMVLYKVGVLPTGVADLVAVLRRCAELTAEAMPRLRSMTDLREYWVEVDRLERRADRAYRRLVADLFDHEEDPITIIKVKGVLDALEEAADAFERLANGVEAIALKES